MTRHVDAPPPAAQRHRPDCDAMADRCRGCTLHGAGLCRAVVRNSPPGATRPRLRRFEKGQPILDSGTPCGLGVIRRGYARRSTIRLDGKRILLGLAAPGDIVSGLTCRGPACDLEAATAVELCLYDQSILQMTMQKNPQGMAHLLRVLDDQHQRLLGTLWRYGGLTSRERIIAFLIAALGMMPTEPQPDGSVILTLVIDRRDWADLTNTAVETISRTLRYLEDEGLVTGLSTKVFRIHDPARLALLAGVDPPESARVSEPVGRHAARPDRLPA